MMTKKGLAHAELESLFWKWANAAPQEYRDLEAFFTSYPGIAGLPIPTITLLKAAFDNRVLSRTKLKLKTERDTAAAQTAELKDLGLDPQLKPEPTAADVRELIHDYEPILRRVEAGEPCRRELCLKTKTAAELLGWDYYRGPKWTDPPGDIRFLNDMISKTPDAEMNEGQIFKATIIGREFFKWLQKLNKSGDKANGVV